MLWAGVGCEAVWSFGDANRMNHGAGGEVGVELISELVCDVLCDVFCGGVEGVEWGSGIEVVVGEWLADFDEGLFYEMEVAEETFMVELITRDYCGGFEVVAVDWFLGAEEDDGVCSTELVGYLDGEHDSESSAVVLLGWVLFQVERERNAMIAMMRLATTPAAECAMRLNAIQQIEARAAKIKPSFLWMPSRCMERNMNTAAIQSRP